MSRRARGALLGILLGTAAGLACVRVEAGPNTIAAVQLGDSPPSIVRGDVLRNAAGAPIVLSATVFDGAGSPIATAPVRFYYVPTLGDTANGTRGDASLVVDSVTGRVTASDTTSRTQAVIAVRVGDRLQLLDTLQLVRRPDTAVAPAPTTLTDTLRYDCSDDRLTFQPRLAAGAADTLANNASSAFSVTVLADSADTLVAVPARLVRWTVVEPTVPSTRLPGGTAAVPALVVADSATGASQPLDTTSTTGRSVVRLRIRPTGLGRDVLPDAVTAVRLQGVVQPGGAPVRGGVVTVTVPIKRQPFNPSAPPACQ